MFIYFRHLFTSGVQYVLAGVDREMTSACISCNTLFELPWDGHHFVSDLLGYIQTFNGGSSPDTGPGPVVGWPSFLLSRMEQRPKHTQRAGQSLETWWPNSTKRAVAFGIE